MRLHRTARPHEPETDLSTHSPLYLTRDAFELLKKDDGKVMDSFRLHTDSIMNVMVQLGPGSLTVAVIMDLEDWFPNSLKYTEAEHKAKPCELTATIRALHNALAPGGRVFWRSSAISPWYQELYRREGFSVECIHSRPIGGKIPIDRVNMCVCSPLGSRRADADLADFSPGTRASTRRSSFDESRCEKSKQGII